MTGVSLRDWLEAHGPDLGVIRVGNRVVPAAYEATALLAQLETADGAPPILFEAVSNLNGSPSVFRMLFNAYSNRKSVMAALGVDLNDWRDLLEQLPQRTAQLQPHRQVDRGVVQTHVQSGSDVDLEDLPWTRHVEGEGGPYLTPIVVSRHPGSARYNLSWNRVMFLDRRHAGIHISPRQLWSIQRMAEEGGEDLPVALVLGHHPAFNLAAASLTAMEVDEYDVAGGLMGSPVDVVPSISYGHDLLVPAQSEALIEGRILAGKRAVEGPFGEYMKYLGPQKLSHVLEVDAVTFRDRPTILEIFAGHQDHLNAHLSIHASLLASARNAVPQVLGLGWFKGGGPTTAVIGLKKSAAGQPMRAALAVMAAGNLIKQVIVVDEDIDVFDAQQVLWAVSTRVRAEDDVSIFKGLQGSLLDPSHPGFGTTHGMVIDATWALDSPPAPIAHVPDEAVARYPLEGFDLRKG